ncbi:MAG: hypothetical protein BECKG1743D_GA0114223_101733 [Candidatus Kentron sp. G]|nr:MAG: hypothetical protein BECKG1743D_GA0114223_101733 [Candidatus Kentron sp. G]
MNKPALFLPTPGPDDDRQPVVLHVDTDGDEQSPTGDNPLRVVPGNCPQILFSRLIALVLIRAAQLRIRGCVSASRQNPNGVGLSLGYQFFQDFYFSEPSNDFSRVIPLGCIVLCLQKISHHVDQSGARHAHI